MAFLLQTHLNGQAVQGEVTPSTLLVDWLRDARGLTGTHIGCDTSQCGACTVLLDGQAVKACAVLAVQAQGRHVTTIEGLVPPEAPPGTLHPVQDAFVACHGLQCGFRTPGMVMATVCLLRQHPQPSDAQIAEALEGNLCRCTGYAGIVESVRHAVRQAAPQEAA